MSTREERLAALARHYALGADDWWDLKRGSKKTWVIYHDAVERIGSMVTESGHVIRMREPRVLHDGAQGKYGESVVLLGFADLVNPKAGEVVETFWATGECNELNHDVTAVAYEDQKTGAQKWKVGGAPYPWAMAEKRLKDRLILKAAGLSAVGCYSDAEADFGKPEQSNNEQPATRSSASPSSQYPDSPIVNGGRGRPAQAARPAASDFPDTGQSEERSTLPRGLPSTPPDDIFPDEPPPPPQTKPSCGPSNSLREGAPTPDNGQPRRTAEDQPATEQEKKEGLIPYMHRWAKSGPAGRANFNLLIVKLCQSQLGRNNVGPVSVRQLNSLMQVLEQSAQAAGL